MTTAFDIAIDGPEDIITVHVEAEMDFGEEPCADCDGCPDSVGLLGVWDESGSDILPQMPPETVKALESYAEKKFEEELTSV